MELLATTSMSHDSGPLPQEIIFEILLRLPVKSLLRMRCVSKSLLSLVSTPQFIRTHLKFSTKKQDYARYSLLFTTSNEYSLRFYNCSLYPIMYQESPHISDELDFPCKEPFVHYNVVGSCNGLFCIDCSSDLFLWNPSIRKLKNLPFFGSNMYNSSYLAYGFGYNECQDDYKVVGRPHSDYGFHNEVRFIV
ncbi:hypothetical protein K7X08_008564 [Anisodus acutangulus]|uniref:F-box domain-containing protein n=1 Tax=Anisodus acutangulus TaxID=402998 RepID=A0A9Q1RQ42_9SOLA|nr:hypothetical protein K7X08_008564 [Anisodus acutangulus]